VSPTHNRLAGPFGGQWTGRKAPSGTVAERMEDVFDIYTIIFLALAVFIFLRLRSVLGSTHRTRTPAIRSLRRA